MAFVLPFLEFKVTVYIFYILKSFAWHSKYFYFYLGLFFLCAFPSPLPSYVEKLAIF